ncbi:MAG: transglycosylase domain-containing protein [Rubrivivax sp.]|nr:transglycosylase domain-containing protein [Pyrinomonadaceae bacterium]
MAIELTAVHGRRRRLPGIKRANVFIRPRSRRALLLSRALRVFGAFVLISLIVVTATFAYLYSHYSAIVDRRLAAGYLTTRAGIYAAPRVLRRGQKLTPERLSEGLRRAGYVDSEASRVWNGRFRRDEAGVEILPTGAGNGVGGGASQAFGVVRVGFDKRGHVDSITGDGAPLDSFTLEPEPLTGDAGEKTAEHAALSYADVPPRLARAILSIEDRRFFEHGPLDLWAIGRAALSWGVEDQDFKQGGSTITQQLVKNTYLTPERTLRRKFHEAALASVIERRMSKEDIFALYCNEIYLGQRGSIAVRGVRQAARVFFGKELKDLSLAEAATVAGMIQSPGRYAPDRHADNAKVRRNTVLAAMLRDGAISKEEARAAAVEPVSVAHFERAESVAPYFIDYANRVAESRLSPTDSESEQNLRVYTTLDLELQQIAEDAVAGQLARL